MIEVGDLVRFRNSRIRCGGACSRPSKRKPEGYRGEQEIMFVMSVNSLPLPLQKQGLRPTVVVNTHGLNRIVKSEYLVVHRKRRRVSKYLGSVWLHPALKIPEGH